ncbi:MAG: hypothetical protein WB588_00730 [Dehalococcoidia bacterium]
MKIDKLIRVIFIYIVSLVVSFMGGQMLSQALNTITDSPGKTMLSIILIALGILSFIANTLDAVGLFKKIFR